LLEQRRQLVFGHDAVLVRVSSLEEWLKPWVRNFRLGELAVLVGVESHHLRHRGADDVATRAASSGRPLRHQRRRHRKKDQSTCETKDSGHESPFIFNEPRACDGSPQD
jgi:hypothetical protein